MVVLNLAFDEGQIPMGYKMRLNEYLATVRAAVGDTDAVPAAKAPAVSAKVAVDPAVPVEGGGEFSMDDEEAPEAAAKAATAAPKAPTAAPAAKGAKPTAGGKA
jgi:hypothetical protein